MSLTQTYYVAATARSKLGKEATRPDHNLRLLVGHANLLDSLMVELADAEREQEHWFNQSVQKASKSEEPRHVQWVDTIVEVSEEDDSDSDSESESEFFDEDAEQIKLPLKRIRSPPVTITSADVPIDNDSDEDMYEDEEDDEEHTLTRTESHPPELIQDDDSDDDLSQPPSPPQPTLHLTEKQRKAIATTAYYEPKHDLLEDESEKSAFERNGYFMPERPQQQMIASY